MTEQEVWNSICQNLVQQFGQHQYDEAVIQAISSIGKLLQKFYAEKEIEQMNELPNEPIILD